MPERTTSVPRKIWALTAVSLIAGASATAFFATVGPVDPLRDVYFSLAVALDLISIFLMWKAVATYIPPWLQGVSPLEIVRIVHNEQAATTVVIRIRRFHTPQVTVIFGGTRRRRALLALGLIAYLAALAIFWRQGNNAWTYLTWGVGVLSVFAAYTSRPAAPRHIAWRKVLTLLSLLGIAFALRVYHLTTLPLQVHGDMASVGLQARQILHHEFDGWFSLGWATIPMWGYIHEVLTMKLWGDTLFGLRMSAVLAGTFSLLGVYMLGKEAWDEQVGWLALAVGAIDAVHIHFSRIPSYIDPVPWAVWSFYFLLRGYRRRTPMAWVAAGITTAIATNMYFSGRVLIPIVALWAIYLLIFHRKQLAENKEGIIAYLIAFFVTFGPMIIVALRDFPAYISRANHVMITDPGVYTHLLNKYQASTLREIFFAQVQRTLLTFQYYGDTSTQFGYPHPMLNPWLAPFFLLGVGIITGRLRHPGNFLLTTWILLSLLLGSILTVDAPFWPRLVIILPANALTISIGMRWTLSVLKDHPRTRALIALLLILLILWAGWLNWHTYTREALTHVGENDFTARFILTLKDRPACYLRGEHTLQEREFQFLLHGRQDMEIAPDTWTEDLQRCVQHHGVIVAPVTQQARVNIIVHMYPGGRLEEVRAPAGEPRLLIYWLP